jgi:hypothetical protein
LALRRHLFTFEQIKENGTDLAFIILEAFTAESRHSLG